MNSYRSLIKVVGPLMLLLCIFWEIFVDMPVPWWIYLTLASAFAIAWNPWCKPKPGRPAITALGVVLPLIALLFFVPWSSRKSFLRDLSRIREGMTKSEVKEIMDRHIAGGLPASPFPGSHGYTIHGSALGNRYSASDPPAREEPVDSLVFRHSDEGYYNADLGIVSFSGGRVSGVTFSPD